MDDFLTKQDKELQAAQIAALKRILRLLQKSRAEVIGNLFEEVDGFQEEALLSILKNIDVLMVELRNQLGTAYQDIVKEGAKKGFDDQNAVFQQFFAEKLKNVKSTLLFGVVELKVLTTLEMNVNDFLGRFTDGLREKIKGTIQQAFIHGRTQGETIQIIRDHYDTQLAPTKRAVHHIYQTCYNAANQEVLEDLQKTVPGMEKQWWSLLDNDTTKICESLHEQIQPIDKPFIHSASGSKWMYPPAVYGNDGLKPQFHFCRSRAIPYMKGFE